MNKLLFYVCIALAIFGCSGDMNDLPGLGGERKCGDILYNATDSNMRCQNDVAESRCGQTWYDISDPDLICTGDASYGILLTRCGTREYSNPYEDYYENPQNYFDASVQFCLDNAIYYKCGGREYDASTQYCSGNALSTYDSVKYGDQSYKTVVIGTQTLFAENLNYDVSDNDTDVCYNNDPANCTKYGRLYDWATAMGLETNCNNGDCSEHINTSHQGICPSGWHIPSQDEWNTLSSYVESNSGCSNCDAGKLKTASGWYNNGNGTNKYGFSALPGGSRMNSFGNASYYGSCWSAGEYDGSRAYYRDMLFNDDGAYWYDDFKSYLFSVRCLQN